jgi:hypothetical protein
MRVVAFILAIIAGLGLFLTVAGMAEPQAPVPSPAAVEIIEARIAGGYGNRDANRIGEIDTTTAAIDIKSCNLRS